MTAPTNRAELIARAVEAMREDPFMDDIRALGTTAQDDRMTHYATIAVAAFEGCLAPSEERREAIAGAEQSAAAAADIDYEVWQENAFGDGDGVVAVSSSKPEAWHYAAVYSQDAPAWVVEVSRRRLAHAE